MMLLSLHVDAFGKLQNYDKKFTQGVNCIYESNGWGKTTFCAFLRAMFYGFSTERKDERNHYRPQNGGNYGGSVTYRDKGETFTLYRHFGETGETFQLINSETGNTVAKSGKNFGETLFGVTENTFLRTVFNSDAKGKDDGNLVAKLQNQTGSNVEKAKVKLEKLAKKYVSGHSAGLYEQTRNRLLPLQKQIGELEEKASLTTESTEAKPKKNYLWVLFFIIGVAGLIIGCFVHPFGYYVAGASLPVTLVSLIIGKRKADRAFREDEENRIAREVDKKLAEDALYRLPALKKDAETLQEQMNAYQKKSQLLSCACEILTEAQNNLTKTYLPEMEATYADLLHRVKEELPTAKLDTKLNVTVLSNGQPMPLEWESTGNRDIYDFCMRYALLKSVFQDNAVPMVLDDPFVHLDQKGLDAVRELLRQTNNQQILYFTCHESRKL